MTEEDALFVPSFISDYVMMLLLLFSPSRLSSSPDFLLLSLSLTPTLCSLDLLLPHSHYLSLFQTPPLLLSSLPFFPQPCVCVLHEHTVCLCLCAAHVFDLNYPEESEALNMDFYPYVSL